MGRHRRTPVRLQKLHFETLFCVRKDESKNKKKGLTASYDCVFVLSVVIIRIWWLYEKGYRKSCKLLQILHKNITSTHNFTITQTKIRRYVFNSYTQVTLMVNAVNINLKLMKKIVICQCAKIRKWSQNVFLE